MTTERLSADEYEFCSTTDGTRPDSAGWFLVSTAAAHDDKTDGPWVIWFWARRRDGVPHAVHVERKRCAAIVERLYDDAPQHDCDLANALAEIKRGEP